MKSIRVNGGSGYDITIGGGLIKSLGKTVRSLPLTKDASKVVVVCDSNVSDLYCNDAIMALKLAGFSVTHFALKPLDASRKINAAAELCSAAATAGLRKGDVFVAIGGIVACDITGIAAALYLGGSPFIIVPTTTLAQVCRSVGATYNADLPEGRRLIGLKWPPAAVLCDIDALATQTARSRNNGNAEIIKLACVSSDKLLDDLGKADKDMENLIYKSISIRAKLALKDERPSGSRPLLHFGSLMCRAIEEVSGYSFDHGEALSMAMVITCAAAERAGIAQVGTTDKLETILSDYGLPVTTNIPAERLIKAVTEDKYVSGQTIVLPLIKSIGVGVMHQINTADLKGFFIRSLPDWAK